MIHILVVEDDEVLRKIICRVLNKSGYQAFAAMDGNEALDILDKEHMDLMVSDIMMPGLDGYQLTEELRNAGYTLPVLMVTAKETFEDKKKGFMAGTDDYMVKPIDMNEMLLRVGALLRRAKIASEHKLIIGNSVLNYDSLTVSGAEESVVLPQKEFYLLFKLLSYPNKTFTRQVLMDEIWGMDSETVLRTVDVHINRLRERFKDWNDFEIITVHGLGYKAVQKNV